MTWVGWPTGDWNVNKIDEQTISKSVWMQWFHDKPTASNIQCL